MIINEDTPLTGGLRKCGVDKYVYGTGIIFGIASTLYQAIWANQSCHDENKWPAIAVSVGLVSYSLFGLIRSMCNDCQGEQDFENQARPITENLELEEIAKIINSLANHIQPEQEISLLKIEMNQKDLLLQKLRLIENHIQYEKTQPDNKIFFTKGSDDEDSEESSSVYGISDFKLQAFKNGLNMILQDLPESETVSTQLIKSKIQNLLKTHSTSTTSSASSSAANSRFTTPITSPFKGKGRGADNF